MNWQVPRIWEGGEVWLLGGGPSVTKQFNIPNNVVEDVKTGVSPPAIYSPYMQAIHDKHVIAINAAYLIGEWIDMVFFGDQNFFLAHMQRLAEWPGIKVSSSPAVEKYNWVKFLPRDTTHPRGISNNPKAVSWNANSGSAAISVAANAGAKRVILVGFDMKLAENGDQHWHSLYKKDSKVTRRTLPRPRKNLPFVKHLVGFPQIARDAQSRGIEIINACPDSAIELFPKCNVKDLL